ncbi:MAG: hypothetical protein DMF97_21835 [Acidobacteria bacterium]|nr:MAG: hypothetical protein DMF97_21835 [Acidobacteriota bacterium]
MTLANVLVDAPRPPRTEKCTSAPADSVKQQARALGAAQSRQAEADAVTVAGDAMVRRGVPLLRLILSAAALLIIYLDPSEPDRNIRLTYATLAAYTAYSFILFIAASFYNRALPKGAAHWVDLAWHTLLVSESSGTNSLFFFFYFFDILVASFRGGAREGLRMTGAAAILFTAVGLLFSPSSHFEANRLLMRPIYLGVLGYMIASFGELELRLRRRVDLLKEVTVLSNPRFGVHQTITSALEKIRRFYDADACLLIIDGDVSVEHCLYQARREEVNRSGAPESCAPEMAAMLLSPPFSHAMLVEQRRWQWRRAPFVYIEDATTQRKLHKLPAGADIVLSALDAPEAVGRLYVTGRQRAFDLSDLEFLSHAINATLRVTDNVRLVDSLASHAAEHERHRIARGIHDTVIQPFIGLQIGLRAIVHRMDDKIYQPGYDIMRLVWLIDDEVGRLRQYVTSLKVEREARIELMPAIRRFTREFGHVTGIDVEVSGPDLAVGARVGAELFEMTTEALSNIRRHTTSHRATIVVEQSAETIVLRIENDTLDPDTAPFDPRSLAEHAEALGGKIDVHCTRETTALVISIPL